MKLLFAVDLTEPEAVTRHVVELTQRLGAELYVLHVHVPPPVGPLPIDPMTGFGDMTYAVYDPAIEASVEATERHQFDFFVRERFSIPVRPALLQGDPALTILDNADTLDADLIVVAKRRHGALERFLLGSVSESVLHHAKRPVLVVPVTD